MKIRILIVMVLVFSLMAVSCSDVVNDDDDDKDDVLAEEMKRTEGEISYELKMVVPADATEILRAWSRGLKPTATLHTRGGIFLEEVPGNTLTVSGGQKACVRIPDLGSYSIEIIEKRYEQDENWKLESSGSSPRICDDFEGLIGLVFYPENTLAYRTEKLLRFEYYLENNRHTAFSGVILHTNYRTYVGTREENTEGIAYLF